MKKIIIYTLAFLFCVPLFSQGPQLVPLTSNPSLANQAVKIKNAKSTDSVALELPFLEDFSYNRNGRPSTDLFIDSTVYINPDFAIAPPTLGVATFDGLNSLGQPYILQLTPQPVGLADILTSRPINLEGLTPADSVYFSFYYQPQGLGEAPEFDNTLQLFFRSKITNNWNLVWTADGQTYDEFRTEYPHSFKIVNLPVIDTVYLFGNFEFQFRNNASLNGGFDHWNIDYLYLNSNRTAVDTVFNDVAFGNKAPSMLREYEAMPYNQFTLADFDSKISLDLANLTTAPINCDYRFDGDYQPLCNGIVSPVTQATSFWNGGYFVDGIQSDPQLDNCGFNTPLAGPINFDLVHIFQRQSGPDIERRNDTLLHTQRFADFYAYDDGTAEAAFKIVAPGGGSCAVRYALNFPDVLRAFHIQFQLNQLDVSGNDFELTVYAPSSADPNLPGDLLYSQEVNAQYQGWNNGFTTYLLDEPVSLPVGNFFVGWTQPEDFPINIGFDKNTNHTDRVFTRVTNNTWQQVPFEGSLMLRAVVGDSIIEPASVAPISPAQTNLVIAYPNPAASVLTIQSNTNSGLIYNLVNSIGQTVLNGNFSTTRTIDITSLPNGLYSLVVSNGGTLQVQKILIAH